MTPSPSRTREAADSKDTSTTSPVRSHHEPRHSGESHSTDPSKGHFRDRKSGGGFLARIIKNKKKDDDEGSQAPSDPGEEQRAEGADAEVFYSSVDNMGFAPKYPQPPPYIKVRSKNKKDREFNRVFLAQQIAGSTDPAERRDSVAMNGRTARRSSLNPMKLAGDAIWAMEMSRDGKYLAAAGQNKTVRVWQLLSDAEDRKQFEKSEEANMSAPGQVHLNAPVFKQEPVRVFEGHEADILSLSWSKNNFLLSSSMDKTVRLWHVSRSECLCAFKHSDVVTSTVFHPKDDRFFLAGSLDAKLRLWSIPDKTVAYWNQMSDMITAVAFTPDGKTAIAGCLSGLCQFHETEGLRYTTQIHVRSRNGKNSKGSKITGIQAVNVGGGKMSRDIKLLITSNDSRVRLYNLRDKSLEMKFKGNENTSSQIRAQLSDDGRYVVCGSEDNKVYIWSTAGCEVDKKDKWPVEIFEAHNTKVTASIMLPTRSRVLLSHSDDPLFDICNPPPVTLVSKAEAASLADSSKETTTPLESESGTPATPSTPPAKSSSRNASPPIAPSAGYTSRQAHPGGNIIITADDMGAIKVFRQDCAWLARMKSDFTQNEASSLKRASSAFIKRSNSIVTTRSNTSVSGGLKRQGSTASTSTTGGARERILTWRQSVGGGATSSTPSLDSGPQRSPSMASMSMHSPSLASNRKSAHMSSPRISLSLMRNHFGRHSNVASPTEPHPPADTAISPTGSEQSSLREQTSIPAGLAVNTDVPRLSLPNGNGGAPLATIPSAHDREESAPNKKTFPQVVEPADLDGASDENSRSQANELRRKHSAVYWQADAWQDGLKQQLAMPHRDMTSRDASVASFGGSTRGSGQGSTVGASTQGGLMPVRPELEKTLTGWSAMTIESRENSGSEQESERGRERQR